MPKFNMVKWKDRPKINKKFIFSNSKGQKIVVLGIAKSKALKFASKAIGGKNGSITLIG